MCSSQGKQNRPERRPHRGHARREVLAFVSLSVCDAAGRVVPRSNQLVKFSVEGATGKIVVRAESDGLKAASIELQSK